MASNDGGGDGFAKPAGAWRAAGAHSKAARP